MSKVSLLSRLSHFPTPHSQLPPVAYSQPPSPTHTPGQLPVANSPQEFFFFIFLPFFLFSFLSFPSNASQGTSHPQMPCALLQSLAGPDEENSSEKSRLSLTTTLSTCWDVCCLTQFHWFCKDLGGGGLVLGRGVFFQRESAGKFLIPLLKSLKITSVSCQCFSIQTHP